MLSGRTYDEVCRNFKWEIPEYYNIGVDVCDKWAGDKQRLAIIYIDPQGKKQKYTFRSLRNFSNQLANTLKAHGIERTDRVGILLSQRPETLISHLSVYKLGAVAVQLLTLFGPEAIEYRMGDSQAKAVITDKDNVSKIHEIIERLPNLKLVMVVDGGRDEAVMDFWESIAKADRNFTPVKTRPEDPALIIYTSGTTGQPKGTLHGDRLLLGILPGHRVEIITADGQIAEPGELGEIAVKAPDPVMFLEYWKNPRATKEKFIGGWMHTGDYGRKDKGGNFWFSGRQDDIIESGGFRIGPGEVEDCLMKHPAVALVGVIGVSDPVRGEIVKAFILPQAGVTAD
jgi:acyl-coenzyme A synthetase/AMP-(fatty) acid ligase